MHRGLVFVYILFLFFFIPVNTVKSAVFQGGDMVYVKHSVKDDLYITGDEIYIQARVQGDLIGYGRMIYVNDTIEGDVIFMSDQLIINGECLDDIRFMGRSLRVSNHIKGDLIVMAGEILIDSNVVIEGDVILNGGNFILNGEVKGKIMVRSESAILEGTVDDSLNIKSTNSITVRSDIKGSSVIASNNIILHPDEARFYNNVRYWSSAGELDFSKHMIKGTAEYDPELEIDKYDWKYFGLHPAGIFLGFVLGGFLCIIFFNYFFFNTLFRAATHLQVGLIKSIGWGTLYFIGLPIIMVILAVSVVGIPLALFLLFVFIFSIVFGMPVAAIMLSNFILQKKNKTRTFWKVSFLALLLLIGLNIILLIPLIGFLFLVILFLVVYGAILSNLVENRKQCKIESENLL